MSVLHGEGWRKVLNLHVMVNVLIQPSDGFKMFVMFMIRL